MKTAAPSIDAWRSDFERSRAGRKAIAALRALRPDDEYATAITLHRITQACYLAATWRAGDDPSIVRRAALRRARERDLAQLARAASTLAKAWERNAPGLLSATAIAQQKTGHDLKWIDEGFYAALADALAGRLPEVHGGPFLARFTVGNLYFKRPIGKGPPVLVDTMLAFQITFYLRMLSAGRANDSLQNGQSMPADGRPHADVAAAFVNATLGSRLTPRALADRLRKLPRDMSIMPWTHADQLRAKFSE